MRHYGDCGLAAGARFVRRRVLVLANETVESDVLRRLVESRAGVGANVLVVAPALNSRLAFWTSDDRRARRAAAERVRGCLARLRDAAVRAEGCVGDADPLLALEDAQELLVRL